MADPWTEAGPEISDGLLAVAPYGISSASTRVRVEEWLRRTAPGARRSYYVGATDTRPLTLARRPLGVIQAEVALRRMRPHEGVLLLHREATPTSRGSVERDLVDRAGRTVYDIDDALYADADASSLRRWLKPPEKYVGIAARADVVIAGNDMLADWASRYCPLVVTVPTCVEPADYDPKAEYRVGDPPLIGWIGTFSGIPELQSIIGALQELHRRVGARLEVMGDGAPLPPGLAALGVPVRWSLAAAAERLALWDVGIMPLRDRSFNRGKSAYKLLQYAAAGLPSAASPLGVNAQVLQQLGAPGPRTEAEWVDALLHLLTASAEERAIYGAQARRMAAEYSYAAWWEVWRRTVLG